MFSKSNLHIIILLILFLSAIMGCTGLKSVGSGQYLYSGYHLKFDTIKYLASPADVRSEMGQLISLKPNMKILWMRPFLSIYTMIPEPEKKSGMKYWMKYKLGEPPAFIEEIIPQNIAVTMNNRLQNHGHFQAKTNFEVTKKRKTARLTFLISPAKPYTLASVTYPDKGEVIAREIHKLQSGSILKPGINYDLKTFEKERNRIEDILKEHGYFNFKADHVLFLVDTSIGLKQFNAWVTVKPDIQSEASTAYRFNNIYIMDDYSLRNYHPDTVKVGNYFYLTESHQFKPLTILNAVYFEKDSLYRQTDHYNTLRQLMGIGVYKFASVRFIPDSMVHDRLNVNILLSPVRKISLSTEVNAAIKSNNYAGPGLNLNYRNKNLFGGAELLSLTLGGRIDFQYGHDTKKQFSYELTLNGSLTLPKFVPMKLTTKTSKSYVPKTIISGGLGAFSRYNLYQLNSFNTSLGYNWRTTQKKSHMLNLGEINYTNLVKSSEEFDAYLKANPTVKKSFDEQFILGSSYVFENNNFNFKSKRHNFSISEGVDLSGNLTSWIMSIVNGAPPSSADQYTLLGVPYSQFIRLRSEFRYLYIPTAKHQLAWRIIAAGGIPYGNSSTMPYIRQYFVGGTNSIRAFIARSIGPGTFHPEESIDSIYIDQAGDIKLETNLEYRFDIYKFFKGALFADAGNIWLVNEDTQRVGAKFNLNTFYKEIAMGIGYGFRFDFKVIVLRLDLAFPVRIPYYAEGDRWVFNRIDFGSSTWRHENLIWNIAIGYPF